MFDILIDIIFYLASLFFAFSLQKVVLQVFQQTRYDSKRYFLWLKDNLVKISLSYIVSFFIFVAGFLLVSVLEKTGLVKLLMSLTMLIAGYIDLKSKRNKKAIKPLVYTFRIYRQIFVFVLINLLLLFVISKLSITFNLLSVFIRPLSYCTIFLVAQVTAPFEKIVRNSYTNKAKRILTEHDKLIKIGITGSYGKTSTKNIINEVLQQKYYSLMTPASYNTEMGIVKTLRELIKPIHQVFICEMGADKVGDISELMDLVKPKIGVVTAIGAQHLTTFGSQENIIKEKMQIIEKLPVTGCGIINYDNEFVRYYKVQNYCKIISYGIASSDVDYRAVDIKFSSAGSSFTVKTKTKESFAFTTKLLGKHNILNILAAIAIAKELDISWQQLKIAVANVSQIEHRLQVTSFYQHTMIDDSFNANPEGAKSALEVLKMMNKPRVLVTSGMIDLGSKQEELNYEFGTIIKGNADTVILVGEKQTKAIYQGLVDSGYPENKIKVVKTTLAAFDYVKKLGKDKALTFLVENDLPDAFSR